MESSKEELAEIAEILGYFRNIVGPVIPSALSTLDGWTWKVDTSQDRLLLNRGAGPVNLLPPTEIQGERGWINSLSVFFSDPESEIRFSCDQWNFRVSPFGLNISAIPTNNTTIYCPVYNPGSPIGPIYGIIWTPSQFWPYKTEITFTARHPATALTATSQVIAYALGRHFISNRNLFYESLLREGERQALGRVEVPIRRL